MKNFFFKIFRKLFRKQIQKLISSYRYHHYLITKEANDKVKEKINFPVGTRVIYRSNSPGPLLVGKVIKHVPITQSQQLIPIIKCVKTGKEYMPMGGLILWSHHREKALNKLEWWEQWNVTTNHAHTFSEKQAKELENRLNKKFHLIHEEL